MTISLIDTGRRFNREWIFRHLTVQFFQGEAYAITGPNGSGKSTLLQVIAGALSPSEGNIQYVKKGETSASDSLINQENLFPHLSIAAPYLDLIEEMTLIEFLTFHHQFKPFLPVVTIPEIIALVGLEKAAHKQIRYFSSGMKQRVKLLQAIFSNTPILLLDEPCTNLDAEGVALYHRLISQFCSNRLLIVSSNDQAEYSFCKEQISISDFKP